MGNFDWLDVACDRLKDVGLEEAAEFLRRATEQGELDRPKIEFEDRVVELFAPFAAIVERWARDPSPKLRGLIVRVTIDRLQAGRPATLLVAFQVAPSYGASRVFTVPDWMVYDRRFLPELVVKGLDELHHQLVTQMRTDQPRPR
jgi:hypothetical protein